MLIIRDEHLLLSACSCVGISKEATLMKAFLTLCTAWYAVALLTPTKSPVIIMKHPLAKNLSAINVISRGVRLPRTKEKWQIRKTNYQLNNVYIIYLPIIKLHILHCMKERNAFVNTLHTRYIFFLPKAHVIQISLYIFQSWILMSTFWHSTF